MNATLKKHGLRCLFILLLGIGGFYAVRFYTTVKKEVKPVLLAVPNDCLAMLRINRMADFLTCLERQKNPFFELFDLEQKGFNTESVKAFDFFKKKIENEEIWISAHPRNERVSYLLLCNVSALQQRTVERLLKEKKNENHAPVIFEILDKQFYAGFSDGILMVSADSVLVQEGLKQIAQTPSLINDVALEKVLKSAGKNVPANLFLQVPELAKKIENFVRPEYASMIETLGFFSQWIEYDFLERQGETLLSGYAAQDKTKTFFLDLLSYQTPKTSAIADVLPSTTRFFFNLNLNDFSDFYEQYRSYLQEHQDLKQRDSLLNNLSDGLPTLLKETFLACIARELSYFKFLDSEREIRTAIAFQYDDLSVVHAHLERLLNYSPPARTLESITKIQRIYLPDLLPNSLLRFFPKSSIYYFAMIGHHIFFATSEETLLHIRMFFDQQKVLSKTIRQHNLATQMQDEFNLNLYVQDLRTIFRKAPNAACGLQFSGANGVMYAHAYLQNNAGREKEFDQLEIAPKKATPADKIKKKFKGNLIKGPFTLRNHRVKNKNFYLLQDEKLEVYYLDENGKILWKRKIDGAIKSAVKEVDHLKNQKIQYRFQTSKTTYILDIYGRNVGGYPKRNESKK